MLWNSTMSRVFLMSLLHCRCCRGCSREEVEQALRVSRNSAELLQVCADNRRGDCVGSTHMPSNHTCGYQLAPPSLLDVDGQVARG